MSLTAISWLESARRKFFMNSTYIMFKVGKIVFGYQEAEIGLTAIQTFLMVHHVRMKGRRSK